MPENIYEDPEYWCGQIGYKPPGYGDFCINTVKEIAILLNRPKSVLDLGCAYGYSVARLNDLKIYTVGIDISKLAISRCPVKTNLIHAPIWDLPFKDKEFDFAFSSGMLEHVPQCKLFKSVNEILRVSNRGLIAVSCLEDITTHAQDDETHEIKMTREQWQKLFPKEYIVISDSEASWRVLTTLEVHRRIVWRS